ncbi:alpha/beta hydrolase [Sphingomonas sp. LaA6.9]|uniref:alpha/beta hydrolase n=1 Tax=Sphingomonas sp. LaA6.9 TaxID=2919914 RepID=UPI001F4FF1C4|nr:alpha/beta hydrolase [Sphingomonas sp. LaA6.9]MCJ8159559.1 alpha/beta hydrolase [Sphingomonas sp. LaA6.9]
MTKNSSGALRRLLLSSSLAASAMLMSSAASAALPVTPTSVGATTQINGVTVENVAFNNNGITMSGNVYRPRRFDAQRKYPAIVVVHPGGGVKEQTAGLYALKMAEQGFVTLAFDAAHQGASGGLPRFIDDPMKRVVDFYSAVDYLSTLSFVDTARLGALGVRAGSGVTVKASMTDRRIKALAIVSGIDSGAAARKGWDGTTPVATMLDTLAKVGAQRSAEAAGAAPVYVNYVPALGDTSAPRDLQEAADYYLTERGRYPTSTNQMLMTSVSTGMSFTGFEGADTFITQPLLMIAGSEAGSLWHSKELHAKAASRDKELVIIPGATHMDLYDGPGADTAASKLAPFFKSRL